MTAKDDMGPLGAGLTPEQAAPLFETAGGPGREPGWWVVLDRQPQAPTSDMVGAFARGLDLDAYSARQRLIAPTPRVLRREVSRTEAERWLAWMRSIDLLGFLVAERDLAAIAVHPAASTILADGVIECAVAPGGASEVFPVDGLLAIVVGEVSERVVVETTTGGGLLGPSKLSAELAQATLELVVDVWMVGPPLAVVRLRQSQWRPDPGGGELVVASALRDFARQLSQANKSVPVFGEFARAADVLGSSWRLIEAASTLNWSLGLSAPPGARLVRQQQFSRSNAAAFGLYSVLCAHSRLKA